MMSASNSQQVSPQKGKAAESKAPPMGLPSKEIEGEIDKLRELVYQGESVKVQTELYL